MGVVRWIGVVLLCVAGLDAAPLAQPRIPIAPPGGKRASEDLVTARLHSLLAGRAIRHHAISFVPLHARSPGEARRRGAKLPHWLPGASGDRVRVTSPVAGALLVRHQLDRPLLVTPGRAWTLGKIHLRTIESALVEPDSSAFLRVARGATPASDDSAWIDAPATGTLLIDSSRLSTVATFQRDDLETSTLYRQCERATRELGQSGDRTVVGCVALVGGDPVVAYAFGDGPVFVEARRDLVAIAVATAQRRIASGTPEVVLRQRAERANARGVSVAMLRTLCESRRRSREVPGGGARWSGGSRTDGVTARALLDGEGRLIFFGAWQVPPLLGKADAKAPPPVAKSDPEEDQRRKKSGRMNPLRNGRAPHLPPLPSGR